MNRPGPDHDDDKLETPGPRHVSVSPRRLTVEALTLVLLAALVILIVTYVFIITRGTDDPEVHAAGVEVLSTLGAVAVGALAGWMGRSAVSGDVPVRAAPPPETDE